MDAMNMTLEEILRGFALQAESWKLQSWGLEVPCV